MERGAETKREPAADCYPLSPMQQGMLLHHLRAREAGVDIGQVVVDLPEAIEPARFEGAWQRLADPFPVRWRQSRTRRTSSPQFRAAPRQSLARGIVLCCGLRASSGSPA